LLIWKGTPRVDIRWWQGFPRQNVYGIAIMRVALTTSDITEMMHFVVSGTRLVMWCFTA